MSLTVPKVRQRKYHTKTKGGCIQCANRHIRCCQQRPQCLNCKRRGLDCEWRQAISSTVAITLNTDELRSFQFYRENTASDLRGLVDDGFWNITLLRLSHGSRYLEHLIVSLSSLDEAFRLRTLPGQSDLAIQRYSFSLKQYSLAIEGLIVDIGQPKEIAAVLASCLVCIAIELWLGDMAKATRHAMAGYKIARDLLQPSGKAASDDNICVTLLPSLWRLCAQLGLDVDETFKKFKHAQGFPLPVKLKLGPGDDPRSQFYAFLENYLIEVNDTPEDQLMDGALRYLENLDKWHQAFISTQKDSKDPRQHHLLLVHYHAIQALLIAAISRDELQYDEHMHDFEQIVHHCALFLQLDGGGQKQSVTPRRAPDVAVNMALMLVAYKCRHPQIRRQALRQMYRARRLEGLWSSTMLAILAEQLMALEEVGEAGASNDPATAVPRQCRLAVQSFGYDPGILTGKREDADISSWAQNAPTFVIRYGFPHASLEEVQHVIRIHMKPYVSAGGFGMKSVFWWPVSRGNTLLDEEIPEHTRTLDGPHLGYDTLKGHVKHDLRSLLYMRFLALWVDG